MLRLPTLAFTAALLQTPPAAVPIDPIAGILDAFRTHPVVALGEGEHGNEQGHRFRLSLIRDPRFASVVNDIVVEFGSARYQPLMDRFVRGEDVPLRELRHVWEDTTQSSPVWDRPIYEEFFRAVRDVNASLPGDRKLRVLLGDPPIDWDTVRAPEDVRKWIQERDGHAAALVEREVLSKGRRALVIYGDMHFRHAGEPGGAENLVARLERSGKAKVFTIWTNSITELAEMQPDVKSWSAPRLTLLGGTTLGAIDFDRYAAEASGFSPAPGSPPPSPVVEKPRPVVPMQDQFDAFLYIGSLSSLTMSELAPERCRDAAYVSMRASRMALMPGPAGPQHPSERFKRACAAAAKQ